MDVIASTASYEDWLRRQTEVREQDLKKKHSKMSENAFVFLRATFYRWLESWADACVSLANAPMVQAIGDLHVENFGTWRDAEGRLVWGINDVDEACRLPYTHDLTRLATSAVLAGIVGHLRVKPPEICRLLLDGYRDSLNAGGTPAVLAEHRGWLRAIAVEEMDDPKSFWRDLQKLENASGDVPHAVLKRSLPKGAKYDAKLRVSGVGSLGRPRFVALAPWDGGFIAREAKARVPSAAAWLKHRGWTSIDGARMLDKAVRAEDPFYQPTDEWSIRRLAPDCTKIEITDLPQGRDEERLLHAMGWETANLHLASGNARAVLADLGKRPAHWLLHAAQDMQTVVSHDWLAWANRR